MITAPLHKMQLCLIWEYYYYYYYLRVQMRVRTDVYVVVNVFLCMRSFTATGIACGWYRYCSYAQQYPFRACGGIIRQAFLSPIWSMYEKRDTRRWTHSRQMWLKWRSVICDMWCVICDVIKHQPALPKNIFSQIPLYTPFIYEPLLHL